MSWETPFLSSMVHLEDPTLTSLRLITWSWVKKLRTKNQRHEGQRQVSF